MNPSLSAPGPGRPKDPAKREAILAAAQVLFLGNGYEGSSMDAIAAEAGVSKLTLYSHFGDKEALYLEALKRYRDAGVDALKSTLSGKQSLREELTEVLRASTDIYIASANAARGCLLIGTASVEAVHRPSVRRVLKENPGCVSEDELIGFLEPTRLYHDVVRDIRAAGVKPKAYAHITGGGLPENLERLFRGFGADLDEGGLPCASPAPVPPSQQCCCSLSH